MKVKEHFVASIHTSKAEKMSRTFKVVENFPIGKHGSIEVRIKVV